MASAGVANPGPAHASCSLMASSSRSTATRLRTASAPTADSGGKSAPEFRRVIRTVGIVVYYYTLGLVEWVTQLFAATQEPSRGNRHGRHSRGGDPPVNTQRSRIV